jgi:hypothetical protein
MTTFPNIDPDMMRIVDFCYTSGLSWSVDSSGSRIEFYDYLNPRTVLVAFTKEDDPDEVLESLKVLTVFR